MDVKLDVELDSPEREETFRRALYQDMAREGLPARLVTAPPEPGDRGSIEDLFISIPGLFGMVGGGGPIVAGGLITALVVDLLRSYFERAPRLRLTFRRPDGRSATLTRDSLTPDQLPKTSEQLRDLYRAP
ncbi:MAG TPA: hypothetical protein VJT33_00205 [bacterium]|nr:hypothetical protein [bacterium]